MPGTCPDDSLDLGLSADGWIELVTLREQVHFESALDTGRFLRMLVSSLGDERERYAGALACHDLAGAAESAAEQRDLTGLAAVCADHLKRCAAL